LAEARYDLIVFDWDGTLIDSAGTIVRCIQDAARDMGLEVPESERARHVIGLGLRDSLRIAVPGLPVERYTEFAGHYRRHFVAREEQMLLFPGVLDLLQKFSSICTLAIATGKSRRGLDRALDAENLRRFFAFSRCADETRPKPHPAMLLEILAQTCIPKERALMIGDTSHDLEMARAAGVDALGVTYGAHPERGLRECTPRDCVATVRELDEWLTKNA
jgi:phosphoglycolate phosphatase